MVLTGAPNTGWPLFILWVYPNITPVWFPPGRGRDGDWCEEGNYPGSQILNKYSQTHHPRQPLICMDIRHIRPVSEAVNVNNQDIGSLYFEIIIKTQPIKVRF